MRLVHRDAQSIIAQFGIMIERFGTFSGRCGWHFDAAIQPDQANRTKSIGQGEEQ
jgi:hypothetical protein